MITWLFKQRKLSVTSIKNLHLLFHFQVLVYLRHSLKMWTCVTIDWRDKELNWWVCSGKFVPVSHLCPLRDRRKWDKDSVAAVGHCHVCVNEQIVLVALTLLSSEAKTLTISTVKIQQLIAGSWFVASKTLQEKRLNYFFFNNHEFCVQFFSSP